MIRLTSTPASPQNERRAVVLRASLLALVLLTARAIAASTESSPPATPGPSELPSFLHHWNDAMTARDSAAIRAAYVDDDRFRWFGDGALRYRNVEEILRALQQFPPGARIETSLADIEGVRLSPTAILGSAKFRTRVALPGQSFEYSGVFTLVIEHNGARWRFLRGHTSTLRPERSRETAPANRRRATVSGLLHDKAGPHDPGSG